MPAFDRVRPGRGGAGDRDGPVAVFRCRGRAGVAERGQGPVNAVQVAAMEVPLDRRMSAAAHAGEDRSLSSGLRLSSSNVQTIDSRLGARYPHPPSTARTGSIASSTGSAPNTLCANRIA